MTKRLRKATICVMMTLAILASSLATTSMTVRAADPFWGAAYLNLGQKEVTVYVDVTKRIDRATLISWDFSSDVLFSVSIYSPNGTPLQEGVLFGSNGDLKGNIVPCYASGRYRVVYKVINGNAGGWVGAWIY